MNAGTHPPRARPQNQGQGSVASLLSRRHGLVVLTLFALVAGGAVVALAALYRVPRASDIGQPVPAAVLRKLEHVPSATWNAVGVRNAAPLQKLRTPVAGAPTVFFVGGEYCPYCAAMRWPLAVALSRFGNLTQVVYMDSSASDQYPNTPTFAFARRSFSSPLISANLLELYNRRGHEILHLDIMQSRILNAYDVPPFTVPGGETRPIPFLLIGGRYLWVSAPYSPSMLHGYSWDGVVSAIRSGHGSLAQAVLANANVFTAAICGVDNNRPSQVCTQRSIQLAEKVLNSIAP